MGCREIKLAPMRVQQQESFKYCEQVLTKPKVILLPSKRKEALAMTEAENRFKSLIQPIKDIAANWDIDIAESLTEYLEELDSLRISIDGGKSNLNFAEAALLIQGSTAVYSKKVEYLHQLVLQSLEYITNKKSSTSGATQSKTSKIIEDDDILFLDNDSSFLLLDHVVEEGHNINLKTTAHSVANNRTSRNSNSFASDNNTSRVSLSLMHSILSDDQGSASLKLSTSLVDGSGALLICGSHPGSNTMRMAGHNQSALHGSLQDLSHIRHASPFHGADLAPLGGSGFQAQDEDLFDDHGADDWGGGGDDYDGGYDQQDTPAGNAAADGSEPMVMGTPAKAAQTKPVLAGADAREQPRPARKQRVQKDMFAQLDPHQVVTGSREARRGKTYKVPSALLQPPPVTPSLDYLYADSKPTNASLLLSSGAVPTKGLFDSSLLPILALKRKQLRQARLASARLGRNAFHHTAEDEQPEQYQNLRLSNSGTAAGVNVSRAEEQWAQDYADYGSDGGGDFGDFGGGGDDDYEAPINGPVGAQGGEDGVALLSGARRLSGLPSVAHSADWADEEEVSEEEALARRVAMVLNEDMNQSTRTSYESICQKYIDNFNQGAHLFARETQLSRRVAEWTQRLEPILQQQEEAPQFDIHAYCEQFLDEVDVVTAQHDADAQSEQRDEGEEEEDIGFSEVVAGRTSGEVCRVFLACLQLVNQGSITLTPSAVVDQWSVSAPTASTKSASSKSRKPVLDTFKIRRCKKPSSFRYSSSGIENYRAPSVNDVTKKSSLKSGLGKGKGTKRVFMDVPSNTVISI